LLSCGGGCNEETFEGTSRRVVVEIFGILEWVACCSFRRFYARELSMDMPRH